MMLVRSTQRRSDEGQAERRSERHKLWAAAVANGYHSLQNLREATEEKYPPEYTSDPECFMRIFLHEKQCGADFSNRETFPLHIEPEQEVWGLPNGGNA